MQDREIACIYYEYEGCCSKGREGTFRDACQICKKYKARKVSTPARQNLKRQKMAKLKDRDMKQMMRDYES